MKNIIVLGGDGFLGWPLSLRLKSLGYNVLIIDDFSRRWYDKLYGMNSLVPISNQEDRQDQSGIPFIDLSVGRDDNFDNLKNIVERFSPDAIIHFAQQRSAPISMYSPQSRISTIVRNNSSTIHLLEVVRILNPKIKILHMGTMGVYGYSSTVIDEGYDQTDKLVPTNPGSVYHLTKCHDQLTFRLYQSLYGLDIVDLHQGVVWGSQTKDTLKDQVLHNRYDYDSMYGTVVNRFIAQYAKNIPLTIYGDGNQKRAFIHIEDSIASCVKFLNLDPSTQKVFIANQFSELLTINDVAKKVLGIKQMKTNSGIQSIVNPRIEVSSDFDAVNSTWKETSKIIPRLMTNKSLISEFKIANKYIFKYNQGLTLPVSKW